MPSAALNSFNLNDLVLVKNQYYLVQAIAYNTETKKAKMELLKAVNTSPVICDLTPTAYNFRGVVSFTDPDGNTVTDATRSCCEFYGFTFNPSDSKCYAKWRKPQTVTSGNTISTLPLFNYIDDPTDSKPQVPVYDPTLRSYRFLPVAKMLEAEYGAAKV